MKFLNIFINLTISTINMLVGLTSDISSPEKVEQEASLNKTDKVESDLCSQEFDFNSVDIKTISEYKREFNWLKQDAAFLKIWFTVSEISKQRFEERLKVEIEKRSQSEEKIKQYEVEVTEAKDKIRPLISQLKITTTLEEFEQDGGGTLLTKTLGKDLRDTLSTLNADARKYDENFIKVNEYLDNAWIPLRDKVKNASDEDYETLKTKFKEVSATYESMRQSLSQSVEDYSKIAAQRDIHLAVYKQIIKTKIIRKEHRLYSEKRIHEGLDNIIKRIEEFNKINDDFWVGRREFCEQLAAPITKILGKNK